jgi:hypothetical protein
MPQTGFLVIASSDMPGEQIRDVSALQESLLAVGDDLLLR